MTDKKKLTPREAEVFNIDLLREAVEWAVRESKKDEGQWDQGMWVSGGPLGRGRRLTLIEDFGDGDRQATKYGPDEMREVKCGTAFCVAGWACHSAGDKFVTIVNPSWDYAETEFLPDYAVPKGSRTAYKISDRARDLLGIADEEADELFNGGNTIADIKRIARKIARRRGETL